jgi:outer membrane protein OmpA-like peptidoglycan-associated protein
MLLGGCHRKAESARALEPGSTLTSAAGGAPATPPPNRTRLLTDALNALGAQNTDEGPRLRLSSAQFAAGHATFEPADAERFARVVALLKKYPGTRVRIKSYTDDQGSEPANIRLSVERAQAVKAMLVAQGIAAIRLSARGYGEAEPIASNATAEGRERNRRVELVFSNARGDFAITESFPADA